MEKELNGVARSGVAGKQQLREMLRLGNSEREVGVFV